MKSYRKENLKNELKEEDSKSIEIKEINSNKDIKNEKQITSPLIDKKIQNFIPSYIPINTLSDSNNFNLNSNNVLILSNEMKSYRKENLKNSEEILENGLNLDEQNMMEYNQKIENKINIIKKAQNNKNNNDNIDIKNIVSSNNENKYLNEINQNNKNILPIHDEQKQHDLNEKLPFGIQIPKDIYDKIEYAIDENGNPFNIKQINNDSSLKKPVALIIQKGNKADNYLIDLQGNKISKMEDGYFNYKHNNTRVIIKDFDVQHPELRIYGTRNKDSFTINDEDEDKFKNKENKNNNNNSKKFEIMLNKKIVNLKRNSPVKIKNMKFMKDSKIDKRILYNLSKSKKLISNKKLIPISYPSSFHTRRLSDNYTINRTNNILNKSSSSNISHDLSYTITNSSNYLLKYKYGYHNNIQRTKTDKISVTPSREIKNISCISSRINLYNYKKNKKGGSLGNLNKAINLKNINIMQRNVQSLTSLPSSYFDEDIKLNNDNSIYSNKKSISTNFNSIRSNNISKSKSSNDISVTISNISNKIKYLQNKINNSHTNKTLSIPTTSTVATNNSQIIEIPKDYNTFNGFNRKKKINKNIFSNKRRFSCAILSKEVNDIITDYSTTNNKKEKTTLPFQYCYNIINELKNNENKINSFLTGLNMFNNLISQKNNYRTEVNYNEVKNSNYNNKINMNNTCIKNDNCSLCGKSLLNRMKCQKNNNILANGIINFKRRKIGSLINTNNNKPNIYYHPIISENYMHNINLMNIKNRMDYRNKFNYINSRNAILNMEENKSPTSQIDITSFI